MENGSARAKQNKTNYSLFHGDCRPRNAEVVFIIKKDDVPFRTKFLLEHTNRPCICTLPTVTSTAAAAAA